MSETDQPDRAAILAALDAVADPKTGQGLTAAGLVRGLTIRGDKAAFMLEVPAADIGLYAPVREAAERAMGAAPGAATPHGVRTAETPAPSLHVTPRRRAAPRIQEDPQARLTNMPEAERPAF